MQVTLELLAKCRKNDRKSHNELYRHCYGFMMAICLRYSCNREDAQGLLNLAFLKIISNLDKYKAEIPFGSWVNRITVNAIIDEFRRDKKRRENMSSVDIDEMRTTHLVDFNQASQQLDAEELEKMIQQLPDMSRKVFNLFAIEGYTHKEIGENAGNERWNKQMARVVCAAVASKED